MRKFLIIAAVFGALGPSGLAEGTPVVWEFSGMITRTKIEPGDFDFGFRAGARVEGTFEFDPSSANYLWKNDFDFEGPCLDSDIRCVYQMPVHLVVSIGSHIAEGGNTTVSVSRSTAISVDTRGMDYDGTRFINGIGLTFGYGLGLLATALPASALNPPPDDAEHAFGIVFEKDGGPSPFAAGLITSVRVVPEPRLALLLSAAAAAVALRGRSCD